MYTGNLYVTAPAGKIAPAPYERSTAKPFGKVYCLPGCAQSDVSGAFQQLPVCEVTSDYLFPNGLAVTKDDSTLILAETFTKVFCIMLCMHSPTHRLRMLNAHTMSAPVSYRRFGPLTLSLPAR